MWVCLWGGVSNPLSLRIGGGIRGINFQCLHKGKVDNHWDFSWSYHAKGTTLVALRRLTIDDQVLTRKYFLFYFDQFISLHFIIVEFHHLFCITFIVASPSMPRLICDAIESIFFILFSGYQTTEWICRERLSAGKGHHRHRVDTTSDADDHHHKSSLRPSTIEKGKRNDLGVKGWKGRRCDCS